MNSPLDKFSLQGKVAIVTGASRGLGWAIASGLAAAGATVYGLGKSLQADSMDQFHYCNCDVTDTDAFSELIDTLYSKHARIDILVNAAGISVPEQAGQSPTATFLKTMHCNLTAVFECCSKIVPLMQAGEYGSIINITSIGALQGFPGNPGYVASKGGLAALTRALAVDHGISGIRINNLVPGYFHTKMTDASFQDSVRKEARASRTLLGRWGEPTELVGAAIFLASPASSYVTGTDLIVDGGWTVKGL